MLAADVIRERAQQEHTCQFVAIKRNERKARRICVLRELFLPVRDAAVRGNRRERQHGQIAKQHR